jgi:signal transduction histidine kinase
MEQRIKELGGEFLLKSTPGMGTNISFSLPLMAESNSGS